MSEGALAFGRAPALRLIPERAERKPGPFDRLESLDPLGMRFNALRLARLHPIVAVVNGLEHEIRPLSTSAFVARAGEIRDKLRRQGYRFEVVARAFALVREAARRAVGMRHYDVQLLGGMALLRGMVAEIETGDGKTLTATLAASVAAMRGRSVHVVTVNDYLAARDASITRPIYEMLGLSVGVVVHETGAHQRRAAYSSPITYCTNKEIAFDYLRDRIVLGQVTGSLRLKLESLGVEAPRRDQLTMRGLDYAIVDEVDSVLIDEARTPLIISGEQDAEAAKLWAEVAHGLGRSLEEGVDYVVERHERDIKLRERGKSRLAERGDQLGGIWRSRIRREEAAEQALAALHYFQRDVHYLVRDGKVQIIDEYTGRVMPDRSWNEGLHQLVEMKEGCAITSRRAPIARISYQRFFRRYLSLAGMTGTAREVAGELRSVYGLRVVSIPPYRPVQRRVLPDQVLPTLSDKWDAVVRRVRLVTADQRPVLVGTRSVAASEELSRQLNAAGIDHVVLSAAQDKGEAEIIALAGQSGRVTVATNMAGRGVDIRLENGVADRGGLQVILTERHEARRIDRQLAGRCGRQGDPGTFEVIVSAEDAILEMLSPGARRRIRWLGRHKSRISESIAGRAIRSCQRRAERLHSRTRRALMRHDYNLGTLLGFAGEQE